MKVLKWDTTIHSLERLKVKAALILLDAGECVENLDLSCLRWSVSWCHFGKNLTESTKTEHAQTPWPSYSLTINSSEVSAYSHQKTCMSGFQTALFVRAAKRETARTSIKSRMGGWVVVYSHSGMRKDYAEMTLDRHDGVRRTPDTKDHIRCLPFIWRLGTGQVHPWW